MQRRNAKQWEYLKYQACKWLHQLWLVSDKTPQWWGCNLKCREYSNLCKQGEVMQEEHTSDKHIPHKLNGNCSLAHSSWSAKRYFLPLQLHQEQSYPSTTSLCSVAMVVSTDRNWQWLVVRCDTFNSKGGIDDYYHILLKKCVKIILPIRFRAIYRYRY